MKIRLAKKITKVGDIPPMNMKLSMRKSYWFRKWEEAINNYRCMCICDGWYNCKFHRRFDHRITKAISLTSKKKKKR